MEKCRRSGESRPNVPTGSAPVFIVMNLQVSEWMSSILWFGKDRIVLRRRNAGVSPADGRQRSARCPGFVLIPGVSFSLHNFLSALSVTLKKQVDANLAAGLARRRFWNVKIKMPDYQYFQPAGREITVEVNLNRSPSTTPCVSIIDSRLYSPASSRFKHKEQDVAHFGSPRLTIERAAGDKRSREQKNKGPS